MSISLLALFLAQGFFDSPALLSSSNRRVAASPVPPTFVRAFTNTAANGSSITISAADMTGGNWIVIGIVQKNGITRTVSGITVAGTAATRAISSTLSTTGKTELWTLQSPSTGDIVATLTASAANGLAMAAVLLNGATATNNAVADPHNTGATSTSVSVTSTTSDIIVDVIGWLTTASIDVASQQTVRAIGSNATAGSASIILSTKTGSASSTTCTGTASGAGPSAITQAGVEVVGL